VFNIENSNSDVSGSAGPVKIQENKISNVALKDAVGARSPKLKKKKLPLKIKFSEAID
jgi:hypothetical protein